MININDFESMFKQINDADLPNKLNLLVDRLQERIQSERDPNAYVKLMRSNTGYHIMIHASDHTERYDIVIDGDGYSFIRVFGG